jgi:hypothetical protein
MKEATVTSSNKGNISTTDLVNRKLFIEDTLVIHAHVICMRKKEALLHEKKVIEKEIVKRIK